MAKIQVQVLGGSIQSKDAETVGDVKRLLATPHHAATVNGDPATDDFVLSDYEFVSLAPAVKGGAI